MKRRTLLATALAATLPLGATQAADDVVIGGALSLSGPFAAYGEDNKAGMDMAVEAVNAKGGVLGRKLRIQYDDSAGDRAKAVAIYRKYGADPSIVADLFVSSVEFVALDPVANEVKLPMIAIGSVIPYKDFSPWSFRIQLIVSKAMGPVLTTVAAAKKAKTIAVIYDTANNATVAEQTAVKDTAPAVGLKLTGVESFRTGDQDFSAQLTNIASQKPDLLYVAATSNEAALIIAQARDMGLNTPILGGAPLNDPKIGDLAGKAAYGVMTFASFSPKEQRPEVTDFLARYKAKTGKSNPPIYVVLGYDAVMLIAQAVQRAGSIDRDAIRQALGSTRDFTTVTGTFTYSGPGDNTNQVPKILVFGPNGFEPMGQ
ncbi:MAG: ABC transporter substrate-binding protein [Proteobacteria bacterium]|nr:ABC transporter substrate-binding protein [Pseudomonadota bacterium]